MTNTRTGRRGLAAILIALSFAGCEKATEAPATQAAADQRPAVTEQPPKMSDVELMHVHGLAYSPDGSQILIPSHLGLAVFNRSTSEWSVAEGPAHDYMGFSATKNAIYSSGHPAMGSGFVNPFGVIKSGDGGQTWQKLGFEGETDFHLLAAGYGTNAVYVVNPHPNSKLKEEGIYYTLNDGFTWERAEARGLKGDPMSLGVHPTDPKTVALGSGQGLYVSRDAGQTFEQIKSGKVGAVFFDLDGKHLWFGTLDGQPELVKLSLENRESEAVPIPKLENDAVAYIAQNPVERSEYAVATFKRSVLISQDNGRSWKVIAENGQTR